MLGWKIMERQQIGAVLGQAFDGSVIFHAIGLDEEIEGDVGLGLRLGHPDIIQMRLGLGLDLLGHGVQDIGGLVNPATLNTGFAMDLVQRGPEPHGTIPDSQLWRGLQTPAFQVQEQLAPTLGALAKAVDQAQYILVASLIRTNHYQHALAIFVHAWREVDAVGQEPKVREAKYT